MSKQALYMDYSSSKSLHIFLSYLFSNGKIDKEMYYYLFGDKMFSDDEQYIQLHRHYRDFYGMLSMLTLYDEIVIFPIKDLKPINETLLDELGIHYNNKEAKKSWLKKSTKVNEYISLEEIENLVRNSKQSILDDFRQELSYSNYWGNSDVNLSYSFEYYLSRNYHFDVLPKSMIYNNPSIIEYSKILGRTPPNLFKTVEYDFINYLDLTFQCLASSIGNHDGIFYSFLFSSTKFNKIEIKDCNNLDSLILAADFSKGIGVIPHPENIEEVIEWRKYSDMKSFRSVFSDWIQAMRNGDIDLVIKIQTDLSKANKQILKLDKYEKLNKNTMVALIKLGLSKIPVLDALVTASDFITPYATDCLRGKNSWVNLPAFNSHSPLFRTLETHSSKVEMNK